MAHGTSGKARLAEVFKKRITDLEVAAKSQADQFRFFNSYRLWSTPPDLKKANLYDTPGMSSPSWDRNEINQIYADVLSGSGKDGGCGGGQIAMKLQCDFLAAEERAWRMRHINPVRAACLAHGRLSGHGTKNPTIFSTLKKAVEDYIQASDGGGGGSDGSPDIPGDVLA